MAKAVSLFATIFVSMLAVGLFVSATVQFTKILPVNNQVNYGR